VNRAYVERFFVQAARNITNIAPPHWDPFPARGAQDCSAKDVAVQKQENRPSKIPSFASFINFARERAKTGGTE
jgi:hypothetical protein